MTQLLEPSTEQRFIQIGVSWENFKTIQQGFANSPGVRLFYFEGELEILSTSPEHEIVKGNIGYLVEDFMLNAGMDFVATGSFSQEREAIVAVQADESYCFGEKKSIPDLAIEIVITSGGPNRLKRYEALGVPEVWFWEASEISVYQLPSTGYQLSSRSKFTPTIDLQRLARCAAIASRAQAVRAFRQDL
ncbi:MAG: Uma2 family endonuclease [Cyanobacteria bacterium J06638_22]